MTRKLRADAAVAESEGAGAPPRARPTSSNAGRRFMQPLQRTRRDGSTLEAAGQAQLPLKAQERALATRTHLADADVAFWWRRDTT